MICLFLVSLCDIKMKFNIINMNFSRVGVVAGVEFRPYYLILCNLNTKVMGL